MISVYFNYHVFFTRMYSLEYTESEGNIQTFLKDHVTRIQEGSVETTNHQRHTHVQTLLKEKETLASCPLFVEVANWLCPKCSTYVLAAHIHWVVWGTGTPIRPRERNFFLWLIPLFRRSAFFSRFHRWSLQSLL